MTSYLTCEEAADLLRVSESTLKKMRRFGDGPKPVNIGARVVYAREEIDRWASEQARHAFARRSRSRSTHPAGDLVAA